LPSSWLSGQSEWAWNAMETLLPEKGRADETASR
jgi:hypothetical protein